MLIHVCQWLADLTSVCRQQFLDCGFYVLASLKLIPVVVFVFGGIFSRSCALKAANLQQYIGPADGSPTWLGDGLEVVRAIEAEPGRISGGVWNLRSFKRAREGWLV